MMRDIAIMYSGDQPTILPVIKPRIINEIEVNILPDINMFIYFSPSPFSGNDLSKGLLKREAKRRFLKVPVSD